jgi:DNA polymerase
MRSGMIMKDFHNGINIIVNGQLILTQLIMELKDYIILLQINTDSITFKYNPNDYDKIFEIIHSFENRFNLRFDKDDVKFLYQKNVNNYFMIKENNEMKFKGQSFKNYDRHEFMYLNNSQSIISKCLVEFYKNKIPIEETVKKCYENNEIDRFQLVVSYGSTYDKCFLEYKGQLIEQSQKVNRVFAIKDYDYGNIYKCKIVDKSKESKNIFEYNGVYYKKEKMPNSYNHNFIFNDDISKFDKSLLDLDYYINLCKKELK